jgi:AcrR family transcriptional regulator
MMEDKVNIKERIIKVSTRLFAEKGFDGISIDELAQDAKVNKSMIYYYFSSKEGLLINLIQRHIEEFEAFLVKVKITKTRSIRAVIEELITLVVEYMSRNRDIIAILFHETLMKTPKSKVDIVTFINPLWDKIERDIRARYPGMIEASLVDKLLSISLIISFVIIQDRLDGLDKAAFADAKQLFIQRVTSIIAALITETAKK